MPRKNSAALIGAFPAFLHMGEPDRAFAAGDGEVIAEHGARFSGAPRKLCRQDADACVFQHKPGAGVRRECPDLSIEHGRGLAPIEAGLGFVDLGGVSDAGFGLRCQGKAAARQSAQRTDDERGTHGGEPVMQRARIFARAYGDALQERDGAGVEPRLHAHDTDARLFIARENGALNGRGAPPARQERGVNVEAAELWRIENRARKNEAIGHDHSGIKPERRELRLHLGGFQAFRRADREACLARKALDRRGLRFLPASGRTRRLGIDRRDLVPRSDQLGKRGDGEIGRSHESEPEHRHPRETEGVAILRDASLCEAPQDEPEPAKANLYLMLRRPR